MPLRSAHLDNTHQQSTDHASIILPSQRHPIEPLRLCRLLSFPHQERGILASNEFPIVLRPINLAGSFSILTKQQAGLSPSYRKHDIFLPTFIYYVYAFKIPAYTKSMQKCSHVVKPMSILPKEKSRSNPAYFI
jgi:hypothetical protein